MSKEKMKDRIKGIIFGVVLLLVAVLLIAQQLGFDFQLGVLRWFQWILLALCLGAVIDAIIDKSLWKLAYGVGIGYCVLDDVMAWPHINIWVMILAITAAGLGIHILFFKSGKHKGTLHIHRDNGEDVELHYHNKEEFQEILHDELKDEAADVFQSREDSYMNDYLEGDVVFSNVTKYVTSQNFVGGSGDVVFSTKKIYLDQAKLHNGVATIHTDVVFSTLILYVPKDWRVVDKMDRVFASRAGSFNEENMNAPTLILDGNCVFGTVRVESV